MSSAPKAPLLPVTVSAPEAETALLGALLFMGTRRAQMLCIDLREDDLVDPRLRVVLQAVRSVTEQDVRPDPVTVLGELRRVGALSSTTDRSAGTFLADLLAAVPVPESAGYYARIVKEHSARRRLVEAGVRLQQAAERSSMHELSELLEAEAIAVFDALRRAEAVK